MVSDPLDPSFLPEVFPSIEPYLATICTKYDGESPHEIYRQLEAGCLTLHFVSDEGFCVCMWENETECFIVAAAAFGGVTKSGIYDIISNGIKWLKQWDCSKVSMRSPRKGWNKILLKAGFIKTDFDEFEMIL